MSETQTPNLENSKSSEEFTKVQEKMLGYQATLQMHNEPLFRMALIENLQLLNQNLQEIKATLEREFALLTQQIYESNVAKVEAEKPADE